MPSIITLPIVLSIISINWHFCHHWYTTTFDQHVVSVHGAAIYHHLNYLSSDHEHKLILPWIDLTIAIWLCKMHIYIHTYKELTKGIFTWRRSIIIKRQIRSHWQESDTRIITWMKWNEMKRAAIELRVAIRSNLIARATNSSNVCVCVCVSVKLLHK